ncbi:unnamed protein product [Hyaloperonospora brassicae]|uniref:RxLR effector candidate protein n=1 Tax=Hyaloperonospora brassicae TaxID=162125 RepID=A0AAV0UIZ4_HYABA|nr:unnamed protein product [Hyaloperonospora brassicae]
MRSAVLIIALLDMNALTTDAFHRSHDFDLIKGAGLYEQCKWQINSVLCDKGLFCQTKTRDSGRCMKINPGLHDHCGGPTATGTWTRPCNATNLKCMPTRNGTKTCQPKRSRWNPERIIRYFIREENAEEVSPQN